MQGQSLKWLAKVCDLARVDIDSSAPVLLESDGETLSVHYRGQYSSASRTVREDDLAVFNAVLGAKQFKDAVSLLDDDADVSFRQTPSGMTLQTKGFRFQLRKELREVDPLVPSDGRLVTVSGKLLGEVTLASKFVATSLARAIFTGIKLTLHQDRVEVEASDGYGLLFRSSVDASGGPKKPISVVVPTYDFQLGTQIVGAAENIYLAVDPGHTISLTTEAAAFDCSLLTGEWPRLELKSSNLAQQLEINTSILRQAVSAARVLESGRELTFAQTERKGWLTLSAESEKGRFETAVRGRVPKTLVYDVDALGKISEMGSEGIVFEIELDAPLHVHNGDRHAWLLNKL